MPRRHGFDVSVTRSSAAGGTFRPAASCAPVWHALRSMVMMAMPMQKRQGKRAGPRGGRERRGTAAAIVPATGMTGRRGNDADDVNGKYCSALKIMLIRGHVKKHGNPNL